MQYFISELIVLLLHKHANAVFISCSIHHVGLALHLEGLLDVHLKTFQMQQKTETDGEIVSWISEKARNDDDDYTVAVYNTTI